MPMVMSPAKCRCGQFSTMWRASGTQPEGSTPDLDSSPLVLTWTNTRNGARPLAPTAASSLFASCNWGHAVTHACQQLGLHQPPCLFMRQARLLLHDISGHTITRWRTALQAKTCCTGMRHYLLSVHSLDQAKIWDGICPAQEMP